MTDLYLIAHLVRGLPAFDIAEQIDCPICVAWYSNNSRYDFSCDECNDARHWWIIPTSGHRAYPYWKYNLGALMYEAGGIIVDVSIPIDHPDHYPNSPAPKGSGLISNLAALLRPREPIKRRV